MQKTEFPIGAYYFPGYHSDPKISAWHASGWTEWELVRGARPRFAGHDQPKTPLWGYQDESDPRIMAQKCSVAANYGLNHFIFDWYHYEGRPFLNQCLDQGFLKIPGGPPIKFALMWANHNWLDIQPAYLDRPQKMLLNGAVDRKAFVKICRHVIDSYFHSPYYWLIQGAPYFSIYDLPALIRGLGGKEKAAAALNEFRLLVKKAGFRDLHLNLVHWQTPILGQDDALAWTPAEISSLGFDSISSYVWIHHFHNYDFPETDYTAVMRHNIDYWAETSKNFTIPYFPNVTMGWDASPRTYQGGPFENRAYPFMSLLKNNTPENFRRALEAAKRHVDRTVLPVKHISINAWNEWTEGSYLEPDTKTGFQYLEAIAAVFGRR